MIRLSERFPEMILASQSPARRSILEKEGVKVTVMATGTDEACTITDPVERVRHLALRKLHTFLSLHPSPSLPVLASDTLVSLDGNFLGKAKDWSAAESQLTLLSGRRHMVESGWALYHDGMIESGADVAYVTFRELTEADIRRYLDTDEWKGAAGSYRIQGSGAFLVRSVKGDKDTVIGIPLFALRAAFS
jgi:septum formation protein